jgi:hypothetical protein
MIPSARNGRCTGPAGALARWFRRSSAGSSTAAVSSTAMTPTTVRTSGPVSSGRISPLTRPTGSRPSPSTRNRPGLPTGSWKSRGHRSSSPGTAMLGRSAVVRNRRQMSENAASMVKFFGPNGPWFPPPVTSQAGRPDQPTGSAGCHDGGCRGRRSLPARREAGGGERPSSGVGHCVSADRAAARAN